MQCSQSGLLFQASFAARMSLQVEGAARSRALAARPRRSSPAAAARVLLLARSGNRIATVRRCRAEAGVDTIEAKSDGG